MVHSSLERLENVLGYLVGVVGSVGGSTSDDSHTWGFDTFGDQQKKENLCQDPGL